MGTGLGAWEEAAETTETDSRKYAEIQVEIVRVLHADIGRGMEENELTIEQTK